MGKHDRDILELTEQHVFELFREAKPEIPLIYHGFRRSRELVEAGKQIGKGAKLTSEDLTVVLLSAWFNDAAYAVARNGVRGRNAELARAFLAERDQPPKLVDAVVACLENAEDEESRDGPAREVLHDALFARLSGKNFVEDAELFRLEEERRTGKRYSDVAWAERCASLFASHPFRTRYAQLEYNGQRAANLVRVNKLLRKAKEEAEARTEQEAKVSKGTGKMIGDLFHYLTRNQLQLLSIAVRRTSTLIHVNAIMISLVVALLLRQLDKHRYLLVPTLALLTVNLLTIFLSVRAMRWGNHRRRQLLREEVPAHDANLFIFTGDVDVSFPDYEERMNQLVADGPALQKAMIDHLYSGRRILNRRNQMIRIAYDVFIYGLALSLVVFAAALLKR
jgi:hypothetical protein